jgi:hypothetical protein
MTEFLVDAHPVRADVEFQAVARPEYTVEWGRRATDGALVFHFFPPIQEGDLSETWDPAYRMEKRLEHALSFLFPSNPLRAGFEKEYNSFFVVIQSVTVPDVRLLAQRFLEVIEGADVEG